MDTLNKLQKKLNEVIIAMEAEQDPGALQSLVNINNSLVEEIEYLGKMAQKN